MIVAVDIETTGLSTAKDEIIRIGAVKIINGKVVDEFNTLIHPIKDIQKSIEEYTGITNNMVKNAPNIEEVFNEFYDFVGNNMLVAYNANFVVGFLKVASSKANLEFCPTYIDIYSLCKYLYPEFQTYKFASVCEKIGVDVQNSSNLVDNATACGMLFEKMIKRIHSGE